MKKIKQIVGTFFRIDETVRNDFTRKSKDSSIKTKEGQSKRDAITEVLAGEYNKRGDDIFKLLDINIK